MKNIIDNSDINQIMTLYNDQTGENYFFLEDPKNIIKK